jgi:tetratricopeptide (TPR) repeat protein
VYEELLAKQPDHPERLRNVALVEKYLGAHFTSGNDDAGAVQHHQRALALDEKRLAKDPGNRTAQFDVAIDLANVAESMLSLGQPASAAGLYERSLSLRTALAASDPSDALARSRMAHTHGQLARVYRQLGELPRAYDHGHAAVSIYESSPRSDPGDRRDLARAIWALGDIETARGRRRDACDRFSRAFDVMVALPESVRRTGAAMNEDRLVELGTQAAACGVAAAQKWVATRQGAPH